MVALSLVLFTCARTLCLLIWFRCAVDNGEDLGPNFSVLFNWSSWTKPHLTGKWQDDYVAEKKGRSKIYINGTVAWVGRTPTSFSHSFILLSFSTLHYVCLFLYCSHLLSCFGKSEESPRKEYPQIDYIGNCLSKESIETIQCKQNFPDSLKCVRKQNKLTSSFVK